MSLFQAVTGSVPVSHDRRTGGPFPAARNRAMNRFDLPRSGGEATVRYLDGDYQILSPGNFVRCAVTGRQIPLDELRYWNVDLQEAYADVHIANARFRELGGYGATA